MENLREWFNRVDSEKTGSITATQLKVRSLLQNLSLLGSSPDTSQRRCCNTFSSLLKSTALWSSDNSRHREPRIPSLYRSANDQVHFLSHNSIDRLLNSNLFIYFSIFVVFCCRMYDFDKNGTMNFQGVIILL